MLNTLDHFRRCLVPELRIAKLSFEAANVHLSLVEFLLKPCDLSIRIDLRKRNRYLRVSHPAEGVFRFGHGGIGRSHRQRHP